MFAFRVGDVYVFVFFTVHYGRLIVLGGLVARLATTKGSVEKEVLHG